MMKYLHVLLMLVPIAIVGEFLHWSPTLLFWSSALAVIPLANILGEATEELAVHTGPRLGGLLNATLGNAAELIITIFAIREGLLDLVKASITGSIIGNILLILGLSILLGGLRHGTQKFDRTQAGVNGTMLILAVIALGIPTLFSTSTDAQHPIAIESLSIGVALVMILIYGLGILYSLTREAQAGPVGIASRNGHRWSARQAMGWLLLSTLLIAWLSEILVGAVEATVVDLGISEFFLGVVVIPLVGNVAEHLVGVQTAWKNQMELSLGISVGSSLQVALFVAPLLVFISLLFRNPLTLVFNRFELIALLSATLIAALVSQDG
ncbi:MAG TPA: calcium/proton exchanger, partial [Anaerolineae bacterium]|nr:calcium/proton exchanger [Anaerolineae bacterium]